VRKFSSNGADMTLQVVLQGHEGDVTAVKWHKANQNWITASEDRTIRIWPATGIPCIRIFNNDTPVTALCIDALNGCIITGGEDHAIRVFDPSKTDEVVQKNYGHTDQVSSIVHVAVRNQYVSSSWDNTVRFWNGK
jgi:WD40 repeat protein